MPHVFINQIQPGQAIDDIYMVNQPILRSTTRGDLYIAMFIADKTGKLNARMWQASEEIYNAIPQDGFVHITGRSELYQGVLQVVVNQVSAIPVEKIKLDDYLRRTEKNVRQMSDETIAILETIANPQLKAIIGVFIGDEPLMKNFRKSPAATVNHHNWLGGLLEHTHNMLRAATILFPLYPKVQKDLVLAGIFLHDIGKTVELNYETSFGYSDSGQLLGHIVQAVIMVEKKVAQLQAAGIQIDDEPLNSLLHIIVSHHGQYEFGSPKLPATAEAFMVAYLDNLDAKMNQVTDKIDNDPGEANWTGFVSSLETKIYRRRVIEQ